MQPDDLFNEARFRPTEADALPAADLSELFLQASGSPAYQAEFYRRLLTDRLYLLVERLPDAAETNEAGELPIQPLFTSEGPLPVFLSEEAIFANGELTRALTNWMLVDGRELLSKLGASGVVINPFSVPSLNLSPKAVGQMLTGSFLREAVAGRMEEMPAPESEELHPVPATHAAVAGQLAQLFGQQPRVRRAALAWQPSTGSPSSPGPVFIVLIDVEGSGERLAQEVFFVARHLLQEARVNLKILFESSDDNYAMLQEQLGIEAFYED